MQTQSMASRPWWACLCVPGYLLAAHGMAVVLLAALTWSWLGGLYMSIYVLPLFLVAAPVAWLLLALTHRSPGWKPQVDALVAVGLGLLIAAILLFFMAVLPSVLGRAVY